MAPVWHSRWFHHGSNSQGGSWQTPPICAGGAVALQRVASEVWAHRSRGQRVRPSGQSLCRAYNVLGITGASAHYTGYLWPTEFILKPFCLFLKHSMAKDLCILADMFNMYSPSRSLRSVEKYQRVLPRAQGEADFSCYAVRLWNHLPLHTKISPTISIFKSRLKTKLLTDAFN